MGWKVENRENRKPLVILVSLILVISVLHYSTDPDSDYFHEIYKLLYYIPIILAAFRFGIRGGLFTSLTVSLVYLPHVKFQLHGTNFEVVHRLLEIVVFNVIAYIVGRLAEGERKQRKKYERLARKLEESYTKLKQQSEMLSEVEGQLRHSERLSVMGELVASLAHEVRNPLGAIKGAVEILQDDYPKTKENYRFFEILIKEVTRLNHVIENFLGLARPTPSRISTIHLQDGVNSVVQILSPKARKEGVTIECRLPRDAVHFKGDENKFHQILLNLILNSIAACREGGRITVEARLDESRSDAGRLNLIVADTGCGIPEDDLERIFKPFFTTKEHGTGLGLPIAKRIADEYDWKLGIESTIGEGTRVTLSIPLPEQKHETEPNLAHR